MDLHNFEHETYQNGSLALSSYLMEWDHISSLTKPCKYGVYNIRNLLHHFKMNVYIRNLLNTLCGELV
mgnify:CR=1 FL=1